VTLLDLLKVKWTLFGLDTPTFAWLAAVGLLACTLSALMKLAWLVRRECQLHQQLTGRLEAVRIEHGVDLQHGLSGAACAAIARAFEETPSLLPAGHRFNAQFVMRRGPAGEARFWSAESAKEAFNETTVIEARLNRGFFMAVPGIVTGAGLLVTFQEILVALLDVRIAAPSTRPWRASRTLLASTPPSAAMCAHFNRNEGGRHGSRHRSRMITLRMPRNVWGIDRRVGRRFTTFD
jgi:hypothetical protein